MTGTLRSAHDAQKFFQFRFELIALARQRLHGAQNARRGAGGFGRATGHLLDVGAEPRDAARRLADILENAVGRRFLVFDGFGDFARRTRDARRGNVWRA